MSKNSPPSNSRRTFLRAGLATSVASAAYPALGAARVVDQQSNPDVIPREFELDELTIDDLQQAMQSGKYSSRGLTEKYLARIQDIDKGGPRINSVIEVNPEAMVGKLVIRGTRITVELVLRKLGAGMSADEIIADHSQLTVEGMPAAQAFAADYLADEERVYR